MTNPTCGTCRFWIRNVGGGGGGNGDMGGGHCRRYPPKFPSAWEAYPPPNSYDRLEIKAGNRHLNDAWPNTHQQSWCGEHSPQPAPDQKENGQ